MNQTVCECAVCGSNRHEVVQTYRRERHIYRRRRCRECGAIAISGEILTQNWHKPRTRRTFDK